MKKAPTAFAVREAGNGGSCPGTPARMRAVDSSFSPLLVRRNRGTLALILLLSPSPLSSHTTITMTRKTPSKKNHRAAQHRRKRLLQLASASAPAAASCEFRSLLAACSALVGDIANWTQWLITLLAATLVDGFWFACEVLMQPPSQVLGFLYQVVSELIFVRDTHSPLCFCPLSRAPVTYCAFGTCRLS